MQRRIHEISVGSKSFAVDELGAQLTSFIIDGIDYIRKPNEAWKSSSPLLFPIVGLLKDGYTLIDGKRYEMTSHGFIRHRVLKVKEKTEDSITFVDSFDSDTLSRWPYKYEYSVTYKLTGNSLLVTISVKNTDQKDIYFNIGAHPGVVCPIFDGEEFSDYKLVFSEAEDVTCPEIVGNCIDYNNPYFAFDNIKELTLDYKYFEVDAIVIKEPKSREVKLVNKDGKGYRFSFDGFKTIAFWSKPNEKYLCFEPWMGYADLVTSNHDFFTKPDLIRLEVGKNISFSYTLEVLK